MVPRPRNGLSLCAGGGGLDLGLMLAEPGFHTRCFVEWEEFPRDVLIAAQRAGYFAPAPIWDDVTTFDGRPFHGAIDTILAGYPCQPFSMAGQRRGADDERHLWPDIARIIREVDPTWVFLENVAGHVTLGADAVLRELREMGFTPAAGLFSAEEVGAPHERLRWFCVAYSARIGKREPHASLSAQSREHSRFCSGRRGGRHDGAELADARHAERRQEDAGRHDTDRDNPRRSQGDGGPGECGNDMADANADEYARRMDCGTNRGTARRSEGYDTGEWGTSKWQRIRNRAGSRSCDMGNAAGIGRREGRTERSGLPLFPPGPSDREAWAATLRSAPDMAPSASTRDLYTWARDMEADGREWWKAEAEPEFCRLVDGLADRSSKLRLLGNGVHPLAAGYAFRSLAAAHGLRPMDLD